MKTHTIPLLAVICMMDLILFASLMWGQAPTVTKVMVDVKRSDGSFAEVALTPAANEVIGFDGAAALVVKPGSALTDGNKGDITVATSGTSWTVNNEAITAAKLANTLDLSAKTLTFPPAVLLSTGSYSDPAWITGLAWSKITGAPSFLTGNQAITLTGAITGTGTTAITTTLAANAARDNLTGGTGALNLSAYTLTLPTIPWSGIDKTGSSLADLVTRSAGDLTSGTLPDGRFPATLPAVSGANLTSLDTYDLQQKGASNGQQLVWSDANSRWQPGTTTGGGNIGGDTGFADTILVADGSGGDTLKSSGVFLTSTTLNLDGRTLWTEAPDTYLSAPYRTLVAWNGLVFSSKNADGDIRSTAIVGSWLGDGNWTLRLPPNAGTSGQLLQTDGTGITSWVTTFDPTAPGAIGGTTPAAGTFTTIDAADTGAALERALCRPNHWLIPWDAWGVSVTAGSGALSASGWGGNVMTGATPSSRAQRNIATTVGDLFFAGPNFSTGRIDWSKRVTVGFAINPVSVSTNGQFWWRIGINASTSGDLAMRGIGIRVNNTSLVAQCHNGTTLNTSGTLKTVTAAVNQSTWVVLQSDGAGNVHVWIDNVLATTLTGGPTDDAGGGTPGISVEALNNADSSSTRYHISPTKIYHAP